MRNADRQAAEADMSRPYRTNPAAYNQTRSRTPEQRRAERALQDTQRRQANRRGALGIEVTGDVVRAGPELTDPAPFGVNVGQGSGNSNTADLEVMENGVLVIYRSSATFIGNA